MKIRTGRLMYKYDDEPATDKQREFLQSLIAQLRTKAEAVAAKGFEEEVAEFWRRAKLPDDLTKKQASELIGYLKVSADMPAFTINVLLEAWEQELPNSQGYRLNHFAESVQYLKALVLKAVE